MAVFIDSPSIVTTTKTTTTTTQTTITTILAIAIAIIASKRIATVSMTTEALTPSIYDSAAVGALKVEAKQIFRE